MLRAPAPRRFPAGGSTPIQRTRTDLVIKVTGGPALGLERPVPRDKSFTIGRSDEADLPVADTKISRLHSVIEFKGTDWVIEDLDSRNGLWYRGRRVKKHVISDGDVLVLGKATEITASVQEVRATALPRRVVFPRSPRDAEPAPIPAGSSTNAEELPPLEGALAGIPGTNLGEFRIIEQARPLGRAVFFRALQPSLNRHVLVEVFTAEDMDRPGMRASLQKEVQKAARVLHPNILQIFDYGTARGFTYVTMEYFQGRRLSRVLADRGFVPIGSALGLAKQLAEALSGAIDQGLPAAAISPGDIWVDLEFHSKVKFFREPESPPPPVSDLAYRAPEVLAGGDPADPRAAVYSVGALLYHMLAATPPLSADSAEEMARRARHDTPTPLRRVNIKVTAMLAKVVEQALAKDPKARQESLRDFARELHRTTAPSL